MSDSTYTKDEAAYLAVEMTVCFLERLSEMCSEDSSPEAIFAIFNGFLQGHSYSKVMDDSLFASDSEHREVLDDYLVSVLKKELLRVNQTIANERKTEVNEKSLNIWAEESAVRCLADIVAESGYNSVDRTMSDGDMYVVIFSPDSILRAVRESIYYLLSDYYHPQEKHGVS